MMPPAPPTTKTSRAKKAGSDNRRLTQLLTDAGHGVIMGRDGKTLTRDEALVEITWAAALGQMQIGEEEDGRPIYAKPDMKMALAIWERREGKTPAALQDESGHMTVGDRVEDIARQNINRNADALDSVPEHAEDMDVSGDGDQDTEAAG